MKWYSKSLHQKFLKDLNNDIELNKHRERYVLRFSKLALKHARMRGLEESKVGILDYNDIVQAAFSGLVEGWKNIDWDLIDGKPNGQKALVNYLSSYIDRQMKREIYRDATGVSIPEYIITRTKKELIADAIFGNWRFSYKLDDITAQDDKMVRYIDAIEWDPSPSKSWYNEELNDKLSDIMFELSQKEREILQWSFGLYEKLSIPQIADRLKMSVRGVEDAKRRGLNKLKTNKNAIILKDFLDFDVVSENREV